jgi:Flp pilus assembly protein TadD
MLGRIFAMPAFLIACAAAAVVAVVAAVALNAMQRPADKAFTTESVRLPERSNNS